MKKLLSVVVLLMVALTGVTVIASDYFDVANVAPGSLPDGWYAARGVPGIYIEETSGKPALRLRPRKGAAQNAWDGAFVMFPEATGRVIVEFSAYTPGAHRSLAASVSYQADPSAKATSDFGAYLTIHDGGRLTYYVEGAGWFDFGDKIDTSQWHQYKLDVDVKGQMFMLYVDDMAVPVGIGMFRNGMESVNQVEFGTWGNDVTDPMWVSDVRITVVD